MNINRTKETQITWDTKQETTTMKPTFHPNSTPWKKQPGHGVLQGLPNHHMLRHWLQINESRRGLGRMFSKTSRNGYTDWHGLLQPHRCKLVTHACNLRIHLKGDSLRENHVHSIFYMLVKENYYRMRGNNMSSWPSLNPMPPKILSSLHSSSTKLEHNLETQAYISSWETSSKPHQRKGGCCTLEAPD